MHFLSDWISHKSFVSLHHQQQQQQQQLLLPFGDHLDPHLPSPLSVALLVGKTNLKFINSHNIEAQLDISLQAD